MQLSVLPNLLSTVHMSSCTSMQRAGAQGDPVSVHCLIWQACTCAFSCSRIVCSYLSYLTELTSLACLNVHQSPQPQGETLVLESYALQAAGAPASRSLTFPGHLRLEVHASLQHGACLSHF